MTDSEQLPRRRLRVYPAMVIALALAATACSGGAGDTRGGQAEDVSDDDPVEEGSSEVNGDDGDAVFVYADAGEPSTIDPAIANINWEFTITRNVYDQLTTYDSSNAEEVLPSLAIGWENDGTLWTFTLREGVSFHDGSEFTADDVKASIDRMLEMGQGQAYLIDDITDVRVLDNYTVEIETAAPNVFLPANLSHIEILSAEDIEAGFEFAENANGTGPYRFESWDRGSQIALARNESWWNEFTADPIDRAIIRFVTEGSTRARGLEGGEYDLANFVPLDEALRLGDRDDFTLVQDNNLWAWPGIYLNMDIEPFDDDRAREAMVRAYDYGAMLDYYQGTAVTPRGPIPDWVPGSPETELQPIERSVDAAAGLVEESGLSNFTCTVPSGFPEFSFAATVLQASAQEVGVTVEIEELPFAQAIEAVQNNDTNCFILGNSNISPTDATKFLVAHYVTGGFFNSSKYSDPAFDALVEEVAQEFNEQERYSLLLEASQMIVDTHMIIWAARPQTVVPVPHHVSGYVMDPADYINVRLYELSVAR